MDRKAIAIKWDEYGIGHATLHVPLFGKDLPFEFLQEGRPPKISDKMWRAAEQVLALPKSDISKVADLLWEEAVFSFSVGDYGVEARKGESQLDAHLREFALANAQDALKKCTVRAVQILQENDELKGVYAEINIESATDNSISIIVKDGQIVDFDDDGCDLEECDENPRAAHDMRTKVLAS